MCKSCKANYSTDRVKQKAIEIYNDFDFPDLCGEWGYNNMVLRAIQKALNTTVPLEQVREKIEVPNKLLKTINNN